MCEDLFYKVKKGFFPVFAWKAVFILRLCKRLLLGLISKSKVSVSEAFCFLEDFFVDTEDSVCCFSVDMEECLDVKSSYLLRQSGAQ